MNPFRILSHAKTQSSQKSDNLNISALRHLCAKSKKNVLILVAVSSALLSNGQSEAILLKESFDDANLDLRGWYDGSDIRIAGDAAKGDGSLEYEWVEGNPKVHASTTKRHLFEPVSELYIRVYYKISEGWQWTGRNYHPHIAYFLTTENPEYHGPAASHLTLYVEAVNGKLRLAATDIQNKNMPHGLTQGELKGGYNGKLYDSQDVLFEENKWHCIEAFFKLNSLDIKNDKPNNDGIVRGWFDGKLVIDYDNVVLRSTDFPNMKINQFLIGPYFSPGLIDNNQKLWIDELIVGTKRTGCLNKLKSSE
jgi:hypothetical protein